MRDDARILAHELPDLDEALGRRRRRKAPESRRRPRSARPALRARGRRLHGQRQRATLGDLLLVLEVADGALRLQLLVALALGPALAPLERACCRPGRGPRPPTATPLACRAWLAPDPALPARPARPRSPARGRWRWRPVGLAITAQRAGEPQGARHFDAPRRLPFVRPRPVLAGSRRAASARLSLAPPAVARRAQSEQQACRVVGTFTDEVGMSCLSEASCRKRGCRQRAAAKRGRTPSRRRPESWRRTPETRRAAPALRRAELPRRRV